jgi:hypothetical protein
MSSCRRGLQGLFLAALAGGTTVLVAPAQAGEQSGQAVVVLDEVVAGGQGGLVEGHGLVIFAQS